MGKEHGYSLGQRDTELLEDLLNVILQNRVNTGVNHSLVHNNLLARTRIAQEIHYNKRMTLTRGAPAPHAGADGRAAPDSR